MYIIVLYYVVQNSLNQITVICIIIDFKQIMCSLSLHITIFEFVKEFSADHIMRIS